MLLMHWLSRKDRMDMHKNAPLTRRGRRELVRRVMVEGHTPRVVATALGVCERTVRKWVTRYRMEGQAGLKDRSSRPKRSPTRTVQATEVQIAELRRRRLHLVVWQAAHSESSLSALARGLIMREAHPRTGGARPNPGEGSGQLHYEAPSCAPASGRTLPAALLP